MKSLGDIVACCTMCFTPSTHQKTGENIYDNMEILNQKSIQDVLEVYCGPKASIKHLSFDLTQFITEKCSSCAVQVIIQITGTQPVLSLHSLENR